MIRTIKTDVKVIAGSSLYVINTVEMWVALETGNILDTFLFMSLPFHNIMPGEKNVKEYCKIVIYTCCSRFHVSNVIVSMFFFIFVVVNDICSLFF